MPRQFHSYVNSILLICQNYVEEIYLFFISYIILYLYNIKNFYIVLLYLK